MNQSNSIFISLILAMGLLVTAPAFSKISFDKTYVQFNTNETSQNELTQQLHSIDLKSRALHFGLTDLQKYQILALSDNKVDFRNHYLLQGHYSQRFDLPVKNNSFGSQDLQPPAEIAEYDPSVPDGWWMQALDIQNVWSLATGKNVVIADCDAGYYIDEPDIHSNLLLDLALDLADKDDPLNVADGGFQNHGTSVVAIMSGVLDGNGINGVAFDSKVVPLQNYNYSGKDDIDKEEATAQCILEAIQMPEVDVIVLENQTHGSSETFSGTRAAVQLAMMSGVTIVSAAGNSSNELTAEEKVDTGSIIVGAVFEDNQQANFSNYGARITVAAYGRNLLTLVGPNGQLGSFGGTSGATPQVAGVVAMILEANPFLLPEDISDILVDSRLTSPGNENVGGLLNPMGAVTLAKETFTGSANDEYFKRQEFRKELTTILQAKNVEPSPEQL